jgi:hypothetical protein
LYPSITSTGLVRAYSSIETEKQFKEKMRRRKTGRRKKKIGERNLEQKVIEEDWRN